jgi:hypothetical protein
MDSDHHLHSAINSQKGNRLKKGKSWMCQAEEAIRLVCPPEEFGEEWLRMSQFFCTTFSVIIMLGRSCRLENPVAVEPEVEALIFENFSDKDIIIYTDGSVIRHMSMSLYS